MTVLRIQARSTAYLLAFILFVSVASLLNYAGLDAPMYYDSAVRIAGNRDLFTAGVLANVVSVFPQRPLPMASFYLNFIIGDMTPAYFRMVNVVLLAATALAAAVFINLILSLSGVCSNTTQAERRNLSLALGLIFLVHPLNTYLTLYIWQRMALMACLFYFLSLAFYIAVRSGKIHSPLLGYGLSLACYICAQFSKENSFTLPVVLVMFELAFFRHTWRSIIQRGAIFSCITLLVVALLSMLQHPHGREDMGSGIVATIIQYYRESGITPVEVILTQSRTLFEYISIIVAPSTERAQLVQPYVISRSVMDPPVTLLALTGAAGLLGLAIYLLRKRPLSGFGLLFFLVNISPEYLLVPQYAFFGYRASLPMPGLLLVAADLVIMTRQRAAQHADFQQGTRAENISVIAMFGLWITLATAVTINRAQVWGHPVSFWQGVVDRLPEQSNYFERKVAAQVLSSLSSMLQREGRDMESLTHGLRAVELAPDRPIYHANVASTYSRMDMPEKAEQHYQLAITLDPGFGQAHFSLARVLLANDRIEEAWDLLIKAESLMPANASLQDLMGLVMFNESKFEAARKHFLSAMEIDASLPDAYYHLALILLGEGKAQQAIEYSNQALRRKADYWQAYINLGVAYTQLNQLSEAVFYLEKSLLINPDNETASNNLARLRDLR